MMVKRKRRGGDDHGGGGGSHGGAGSRWLVSYADFITLMFVVFLVLFSMARLDASKYGSLARSLRQALGPVGPDITSLPARGQPGQAMPVVAPDGPGNTPDLPDWPSQLVGPEPNTDRAPVPPKDTPPPDTEPSANPNGSVVPVSPPPKPQGGAKASNNGGSVETKDDMSDLAKAFDSLPGARSGLLAVSLQDRGIVLSIAGQVLFEPGQTTLKPEASSYLDQVASKLVGVELPIMVEGTGDQNPRPGAMDPWDLAALRAGSVVRYFVGQKGLSGDHFVTIGYGKGQNSGSGPAYHVTIVVMRKANP